MPVWAALGFGFSELGGVTWHAQPGNPAPRMFRAVPDGALVNRMGFNNPGAEALAARLADGGSAGRWPNHPVGINLGKSKVTPLAEAAEDYARSFARSGRTRIFLSSMSVRRTRPICASFRTKRRWMKFSRRCRRPTRPWRKHATPPRAAKPILVKVAPDLSFEALDEILELARPRRIAGIVATNTTVTRRRHRPAVQKIYAEAGGMSGRPLRARSTEVIRHIYRQTRGELPIIGVGRNF